MPQIFKRFRASELRAACKYREVELIRRTLISGHDTAIEPSHSDPLSLPGACSPKAPSQRTLPGPSVPLARSLSARPRRRPPPSPRPAAPTPPPQIQAAPLRQPVTFFFFKFRIRRRQWAKLSHLRGLFGKTSCIQLNLMLPINPFVF